jgi:hypothetical protein
MQHIQERLISSQRRDKRRTGGHAERRDAQQNIAVPGNVRTAQHTCQRSHRRERGNIGAESG